MRPTEAASLLSIALWGSPVRFRDLTTNTGHEPNQCKLIFMVAAPAHSIFLLTIFASGSLAQTSGQLQFREIGPAVVGGHIDDFAVVENDPDIIYVATASGGVWKTSDGPITCKPIFEQVGAMSIGAVLDELAPLLTGAGNPLTMPQTFRQPPIPERVAHVLFTFENYTAAPRAREVELDQLAAAEQDALAPLNKSFADSGVAYIALQAHATGRN